MWNLYEKLSQMAVSSHGVSLLPKLKLEHVKLTSFSKMRVDLAAQVILYMYCCALMCCFHCASLTSELKLITTSVC